MIDSSSYLFIPLACLLFVLILLLLLPSFFKAILPEHNVLGSEVFPFYTLCHQCSVFWPVFWKLMFLGTHILLCLKCPFPLLSRFFSPFLSRLITMCQGVSEFCRSESHTCEIFSHFVTISSSTPTAYSCRNSMLWKRSGSLWIQTWSKRHHAWGKNKIQWVKDSIESNVIIRFLTWSKKTDSRGIQVCVRILVSSQFMTSSHQIILGGTTCWGWSLPNIHFLFSSTSLLLTLFLLLLLQNKSFFYCDQDTILKTITLSHIIVPYVKFII